MRFELVDQVLEQSPERVVTVKNVTISEEYLFDHFPSFPVLPGVMMLEAMLQAARRLLAARDDAGPGPFVAAEVRNVRYGNMVRPGEQLRITVELLKHEDEQYTFKGQGEVNGSNAVQGRFTLRPLKITA